MNNECPFRRRFWPQRVNRPDLPADLVRFFTWNQGVGLESSPDCLLRFCQLHEVTEFAWNDVHNVGKHKLAGWESFRALRIGMSSFFDEIFYAIDVPSCPCGSILVIGLDIIGPSGVGDAPCENSLVLATSFDEWIKRLRKLNWMEQGLFPGGFKQMSPEEREQQGRHYRTLNPSITWAG